MVNNHLRGFVESTIWLKIVSTYSQRQKFNPGQFKLDIVNISLNSVYIDKIFISEMYLKLIFVIFHEWKENK